MTIQMKWYDKAMYIGIFIATCILFGMVSFLFVSSVMITQFPQTNIPLSDLFCCPDCSLGNYNTEVLLGTLFNLQATSVIWSILWGVMFSKFVLNKNKEYRDEKIQSKNTCD